MTTTCRPFPSEIILTFFGQLTLNFDGKPLAGGGGDPVAGHAEVVCHVEPGDLLQLQHSSLHDTNLHQVFQSFKWMTLALSASFSPPCCDKDFCLQNLRMFRNPSTALQCCAIPFCNNISGF
jgi:hypothetical protein